MAQSQCINTIKCGKDHQINQQIKNTQNSFIFHFIYCRVPSPTHPAKAKLKNPWSSIWYPFPLPLTSKPFCLLAIFLFQEHRRYSHPSKSFLAPSSAWHTPKTAISLTPFAPSNFNHLSPSKSDCPTSHYLKLLQTHQHSLFLHCEWYFPT